ncbi:protein STICHEL-like [Phoenix dactylifera]|uniref:Protein STICHEL-like n=1 Tax=Phoenix dactylifera TaxID=42345 RepID=A0A8B8JCB0_PHODC|nr:protein STICHEL-like [Phoenix dactylifera]XP_026665686.2 protein STICHEL-like [Phoenix dactylifera]XP_026665687.2 protein STICHEL-like [Phoenix dactylifera]XP_038989551.1 protein STICHEL-like [Phoenix dactylifera]
MVEICAGPSELHLRKELTALRKARYLRDPETCSSWRSPLSSKSFAATSTVNYENGIKRKLIGENNCHESLEPPSRSENRRKKVYLYNWRHDSGKSSDSGIKLDCSDRQVSVEGSPEDSLSTPHDLDSKSYTYLEAPVNIYNVAATNSETSVKRTVKHLRKSSVSKQGAVKHSAVPNLLDLPSSSLGILNTVEQSDDTENYSSEDSRLLAHELTRKTGYLSRSASPLLPGSGCRNWLQSSKIWSTRREGSSHSYTPASTSSCHRYYGARNPSTVGSWDGSATSYDGDELDQPDLPRRQGCGIPCYWSKRTKDRGCGGFYSPSLSDTLRRKGSSILCGSQTLYNKKRSSSSHKRKYLSKSCQGLPLLTNSCDGGDSSLDTASDELSANFGELDLEALSRLDGTRWSSCKSQEGVELSRTEETELDIPEQRSLSQKYRPRSFDEIIGQNIVVQSLNNAIFRGRIAPAYLFQGPRGTGKTSIARIFAAALNCLSTKENKPCSFCSECTACFSGTGSNLREVDAANKKGIDRIRLLVKNLSLAKTFSGYKVFAVDECHMLSSKMWSAFMKFLEEPPPRVVFIFITVDPDNLPRAIVSRCQRYIFSKIKDVDIIFRLRKLSAAENLDVELDALDLIALNSDGSLWDAETMLDQLSLLGRKITTSLVNDLVGVVSEEKLLDLLEIAMSSNTSETVKRSRELMDSGVDPMALMSQLAGLIMDIIAGTYQLANSQCGGTTLGRRSLTEAELERLQQALKILSDAEKQLRLSSERSTWFTAALLQLGSRHNLETNESSSSSKHSAKKFNPSASEMVKDTPFSKNKSHPSCMLQGSDLALIPRATSGRPSPRGSSLSYRMTMNENLICDVLPADSRFLDRSLLDSTQTNDTPGKTVVRCVSADKLAEIWKRCIQRCHSKTLKELLGAHGMLVSITECEGILIALIAFEDKNIKSRATRFLSSITNSMEIVLRQNVEVRLGLVTETFPSKSLISNQIEIIGNLEKERKIESENLADSSDKDGLRGNPNMAGKSLDYSDGMFQRTLENSSQVADRDFQVANFSTRSSEGNNGASNAKEKGQEVLVQRTQTAPTDEQRLESAWLQAAEKYMPGLVSLPKPEKNQVLPQNGVSSQNQDQSSAALGMSSKHWEDELNHEIKALKIGNTQGHHMEQFVGRVNHHAISPSLLHSNNHTANFDRENLGYESGPGCNGLLCWKTHKPHRGKVKQGTHVRSQKIGRLSLFGQCGKSRSTESRFKK